MTGGARLAVFALFVTLGAAQSPGPEQLSRDAVATQQRGDFTAALRACEGVLQARPDLVLARANRAAVLVHLGRFDEAIADYLALLRQELGNAELRLNRALAYHRNGDFAAAAPGRYVGEGPIPIVQEQLVGGPFVIPWRAVIRLTLVLADLISTPGLQEPATTAGKE